MFAAVQRGSLGWARGSCWVLVAVQQVVAGVLVIVNAH